MARTTGNKKAAPAKGSKSSTKSKKGGATSKAALCAIISQLSAMYGGAAPQDKVALRAGYPNATCPAFKMAISRATKSEHVTTEGGTVSLMPKGQELAGDAPEMARSNEEHLEKIKGELTATQNKVVDALIDGKKASRADLAAHLGYKDEKAPAFKMLLKRTRDTGYLEFLDGSGEVQLADIVYPFGRP